MVGVPGRSKGCVTCRKRKKGCDLKIPECGQCIERGLTCGGYDLDRMFIYHSAESDRRGISTAALERDQDSSAPPFPSCDLQVAPVRSVYKIGCRSLNQSRPISVVLSPALARSAYSEKSIEAFLRLYIPTSDSRCTNDEDKHFVGMLPLLNIRDEALQLAVLAIGTAALGRSTNDGDLTRQGRSLYGKALKETAVALRNPTRATSDAVFAIPRVMALFEILFGAELSSNDQAKGWLSHAQGETALIVSRGPEAYAESEEAHLLFINARFRPLIAAVRTRKATVLNEERWKTLPWIGRVKRPNDTLLDILCGVPEMLEAVDILACTPASEKWIKGLRIQTIAKCWTLHFQLDAWFAANPNEVYTPTRVDTSAPIFFPDFDTACLSVRYWVTGLLLYSTLDMASGIQPLTDDSIPHPDRPHPRYFARLIARSVPYFFQAKYGVSGATQISFPLGNALFYMNRNPAVDREYKATVMKVWHDPMLPSAIRDFLASMKQSSPGRP
ncbi:uncharacterized protein K460DRAFT_357916 [Cucurbitaria berberidis CBS 394.84]|uniref:Zn(2)-C6 fungal-type domain-containing protein n=1 Tax=Cucurbitaria berberidis CBS 394.84 TaxID=1168544 RepID=A0A9P4GET5_9PLEO|nr:uncharacterized protein K460DRAFT_357916 [Cucurbitaria berberidis CBS 394.84]KAF1844307.1 hypothetical protein K460DRAFT_357916 [Cucurbitaria berberidis CBS 394.84]